MKLIILLTILFITSACGPDTAKVDEAASDELLADILIRPAANQSVIEITFYRDLAEVLDGEVQKGFGKSVVAVEDSQFNGVRMSPASNLSNQPIYKIVSGGVKAANVITVTVGGKKYETTTMLDPNRINKMMTVTLFTVEKGSL